MQGEYIVLFIKCIRLYRCTLQAGKKIERSFNDFSSSSKIVPEI